MSIRKRQWDLLTTDEKLEVTEIQNKKSGQTYILLSYICLVGAMIIITNIFNNWVLSVTTGFVLLLVAIIYLYVPIFSDIYYEHKINNYLKDKFDSIKKKK